MGPMVHQLEQAYAGRARFKVFWLDRVSEKSPDYALLQRLWPLVHVEVTPTFLVVGRDGHVARRFEGTTPYLSLSQALDTSLAAPPASTAP